MRRRPLRGPVRLDPDGYAPADLFDHLGPAEPLTRQEPRMSTTITCPDCQQTHAVVPSIHKAHPGSTFGERWLSDGPSAPLHLTDAPGGPVSTYTWACLCGTTLVHEEPALESVPCVHLAPEGETCRVHARRTAPPSDVYSNARHGAACSCCGQQGYHLVRVDRAGNIPPCLRTGTPGA